MNEENIVHERCAEMVLAAVRFAREEMVAIRDAGQIRGARSLSDTHIGLPTPIPGDFIFEGTVSGVRREFLVRNSAVIWHRPKGGR